MIPLLIVALVLLVLLLLPVGGYAMMRMASSPR